MVENSYSNKPMISFKLTVQWAWSKTHGVKAAIWLPLLASVVLSAILQAILFIIEAKIANNATKTILSQILYIFVLPGFLAGIAKIYIERARNNPIKLSMGFKYFHCYFKVLVIMIIFSIPALIVNATSLGHHISTMPLRSILAIVAILVYIILMASLYSLFCLSIGLIADKNMGLIESLKTSYGIVKYVFFKVLSILILPIIIGFLMVIILTAIALIFRHTYVLPLAAFIGLIFIIWFIPWSTMLHGMIYYQLVDQNKSLDIP